MLLMNIIAKAENSFSGCVVSPDILRRSGCFIDTIHKENNYGYKNNLEPTMIDIQKIIPMTKAKKDLLDIIKQMAEDDSTVTVTRNCVAAGVLMTPERYEGLIETLEIL